MEPMYINKLVLKSPRDPHNSGANDFFTPLLDNGEAKYLQGNFQSSAVVFVNCSRMAESEMIRRQAGSCSMSGQFDRWCLDLDRGLSRCQRLLIFSLHDAALAYMRATDSYSLADIIYAIDLPAETTQRIKSFSKEYAEGTPVCSVLPRLVDPIGKALKRANSTKDAAHILARMCLIKSLAFGYLTGEKGGPDIAEALGNMIAVITITCRDRDWVKNHGLQQLKQALEVAGPKKNLQWISHSIEIVKNNAVDIMLQ
ncbi:hypothetical protein BKA61DRAFT_584791 [Leptodontidium sp. MPI-SDFR-AT-0119]|nr:hypothetical protein BKA61DRAFT_584791 [Leptodontidium sp. MPI-SDFR-AT-0119]